MTGQHPQRSILLVEDEPLIRLDLLDFFEREGFTVHEAEDADHAIAILEANPDIQVVLTDVEMPGSMNGVRLSHFIRDRWPPTLLIVASGAVAVQPHDLPSHAVFVPKPFDPRFVLREMERLGA